MLFCDSFDHYVTADFTKKGYAVSGGPTIGAYGRNSTSGLRLPASNGDAITQTVAAVATLIAGCAFKPISYWSSAANLISFQESGTTHVGLYLGTAAAPYLSVRNGSGTVLATGTTPIQIGTSYYLEFKANIHSTTGSYTVRINGAVELTGTNVNTRNGGAGTANQVRLGSSTGVLINGDIDDYYICNSSGTANNDLLGDIRVQALYPSAAGATSAWTPSAGANYTTVDETTPNDDTDYVSSATVGQIDTYAMGDLSSSAGAVKAIQHVPYARKDDAGTRTIAPMLRISGVDYVQANLPNLSTSYQFLPLIVENSPATAVAFTVAEVNAMEGGVKMIA